LGNPHIVLYLFENAAVQYSRSGRHLYLDGKLLTKEMPKLSTCSFPASHRFRCIDAVPNADGTTKIVRVDVRIPK